MLYWNGPLVSSALNLKVYLDPDGRAEQEAVAFSFPGLLVGALHRSTVGRALGQSCVEQLTLVTVYRTGSLLFPTAPWLPLHSLCIPPLTPQGVLSFPGNE